MIIRFLAYKCVCILCGTQQYCCSNKIVTIEDGDGKVHLNTSTKLLRLGKAFAVSEGPQQKRAHFRPIVPEPPCLVCLPGQQESRKRRFVSICSSHIYILYHTRNMFVFERHNYIYLTKQIAPTAYNLLKTFGRSTAQLANEYRTLTYLVDFTDRRCKCSLIFIYMFVVNFRISIAYFITNAPRIEIFPQGQVRLHR